MKCRHCNNQLRHTFVDLGSSPPSNSYLKEAQLSGFERWYPLKVMVCEKCWLVQTEDFVGFEEMFSEDYAYYSSYSHTWVEHARKYVEGVIPYCGLNENSCVVELASNDGYLLQFFDSAGVPCYGVEPTSGTAAAAREKKLNVIQRFFGTKLACELVSQKRSADLIVANNVLAHVPDILDFVSGIGILLKPEGVVTVEFPYLVELVKNSQFDTIYHEHYSYLSLTSVTAIFSRCGLSIFEVEKLPTHGGSLRIYGQLKVSDSRAVTNRVTRLLEQEQMLGLLSLEYYRNFQIQSELVKNDLVTFLLNANRKDELVIGYGAAAKGSTMLNFAGIRKDLVKYIVDKNPAKQGKYMPGSRIPIADESRIRDDKPKYIVIFPWNLKEEIMDQLDYISEWGGSFVTAIPQLEITHCK